ncbi:MAG: NAD(P)/FAD-dependent oxidoreductase [Nitriliruptorales bacterium]
MSRPVWAARPATPMEPLVGGARADVCVVGLGAAGLAAAHHATVRGRSVIGLDAGDIGDGASGRNGGLLLAGAAPFHHRAVSTWGRERATAIRAATLAELDRVVADHRGAVRRVGSLRIAADAAEVADCEAQLAALRDDGFRAERYEGAEGRGILLPDDAAFDPARRCVEAAERALEAGASLHPRSRVAHVATGRVMLERGEVRCDAVVVAVDGALEQLLPELRGRVRSARAQMLATAPAESRWPRPVYRRHGWDYYQQRPDGRVVLGGFRDRGGDAEWTTDPTPTPHVQSHLDAFLREELAVAEPVTHRWAGIIGFTDDGLPVVEEVRDGVFACGGYCGAGNLIGPVAARALVDLAIDGSSPVAVLLGG